MSDDSHFETPSRFAFGPVSVTASSVTIEEHRPISVTRVSNVKTIRSVSRLPSSSRASVVPSSSFLRPDDVVSRRAERGNDRPGDVLVGGEPGIGHSERSTSTGGFTTRSSRSPIGGGYGPTGATPDRGTRPLPGTPRGRRRCPTLRPWSRCRRTSGRRARSSSRWDRRSRSPRPCGRVAR